MKQYLVCFDSTHAEVVDGLCAERLRSELGTHCSCWSGVYSKVGKWGKTYYGIYWGAPVSDLFGFPPSEEHPDGDPLLVVEDEILDSEGESNWTLVPPPEPVEEPL